MHVLAFGSQFEIFSCFMFGKCLLNRPQASKPDEENKLRESRAIDNDMVHVYFGAIL